MLTLHIRLSFVLEGRLVAGRKIKKIWLVLEGRGFDADPIIGLSLVLEGRAVAGRKIYVNLARPRGTWFRC